MEGFGLAKSISRLKPYRACILPAKEETEGSNPPKQTTTERIKCVTGLMQLLQANDLQLYIKSYSF